MSFFAFALRGLLRGCLVVLCCTAGRVQAETAPPAPPAPPVQHFDILEYQVEGNTVLGTEAVERSVYPFMGEQRDIDAVEGARGALEKAYHDAGYGTVSVDIPPQKVEAGVVRLKVVQGTVARVRVVGSRYFSQDRILDEVPELAEGKVPNLNAVQQQLAQANTSPDAHVTPLLRPGKAPGTTEVDLQVEDEFPLHGSLELNNAHAPDSDPFRAIASLRYANLFQRGHVAGLELETSPQDVNQVRVAIATYSMPIDGGTLLMSAVKSDSSTYVGGGVGVFSNGKVLGLRYTRPLAGDDAGKFVQSLTLGADWKDSGQNVALSDGTGIQSPIHYVPFTVAYGATAVDDHGSTDAGATFEFAVRDLGSQQQEFADKRYLAHSDFSLLKFNLARTQKLWHGATLYATVDGQGTGDPLVSNEQYVAGGEDSVRGYLESTQASDLAVHTTVELRSANLSSEKSRIDFLQLRVFYDDAWLRSLAPLPETRTSWQLSSYGLGATLRAQPGLSVRGDFAWPLLSVGQQRAQQPHLQASALYQF